MTDKQLPPLPTLQPGDSHMESLIEAAIQGHADTREAMRWLVRQLVPATQPAEMSDANMEIYEAVEQAIVDRYVVEKRAGRGFWGHCVKAGNGDQEIFTGHKNACENVRQALQTACLDGAFMAQTQARAILALRTAIQQAESEPVATCKDYLPVEPAAWARRESLDWLQSGNYKRMTATALSSHKDIDEGCDTPIYTHPAPGVPDDVVRDAQRYRWLRDRDHWPAPFASSQDPEPVRGIDLDAAIDAAALAKAEGREA